MSHEVDATKMKHFSHFEVNFCSQGKMNISVFISDSNENQL